MTPCAGPAKKNDMKSSLETEVLSLLADRNMTCPELLEATDADEDELAVATWNLLCDGKLRFVFDHWEAL